MTYGEDYCREGYCGEYGVYVYKDSRFSGSRPFGYELSEPPYDDNVYVCAYDPGTGKELGRYHGINRAAVTVFLDRDSRFGNMNEVELKEVNETTVRFIKTWNILWILRFLARGEGKYRILSNRKI